MLLFLSHIASIVVTKFKGVIKESKVSKNWNGKKECKIEIKIKISQKKC